MENTTIREFPVSQYDQFFSFCSESNISSLEFSSSRSSKKVNIVDSARINIKKIFDERIEAMSDIHRVRSTRLGYIFRVIAFVGDQRIAVANWCMILRDRC